MLKSHLPRSADDPEYIKEHQAGIVTPEGDIVEYQLTIEKLDIDLIDFEAIVATLEVEDEGTEVPE